MRPAAAPAQAAGVPDADLPSILAAHQQADAYSGPYPALLRRVKPAESDARPFTAIAPASGDTPESASALGDPAEFPLWTLRCQRARSKNDADDCEEF